MYYIKKFINGYGIYGFLNPAEIPISEVNEYIKVSDDVFDKLSERKLMWQNGILVDNPNYENYKAELEAKTAKNKQLSSLKRELYQIKQWFEANDWKVNKIVIGEWEKSDPRWLDYISERVVKRARQDELHSLIKELGIFEK